MNRMWCPIIVLVVLLISAALIWGLPQKSAEPTKGGDLNAFLPSEQDEALPETKDGRKVKSVVTSDEEIGSEESEAIIGGVKDSMESYFVVTGVSKEATKKLQEVGNAKLVDDALSIQPLLNGSPAEVTIADLGDWMVNFMTPMVPGPDGEVTIEYVVDIKDGLNRDTLLRAMTQTKDGGDLVVVYTAALYPTDTTFAPVTLLVLPDERGYKDKYKVTLMREAEMAGQEKEFMDFLSKLANEVDRIQEEKREVTHST